MTWLLSEGLLAMLAIAIPLSAHAGILSHFFHTQEVIATTPIELVSQSATDMPLLAALQNPNPMGARGGAEVLVKDNALVSTGPVGADVMAEQKTYTGEIRVYTVRLNDSLSEIADMFGVTTNTIMWANDLNRASDIQPGDSLVILPVAGVQHDIKSGDSIESIAKKYEADSEEILAFNQMFEDEQLVIGTTLIIPGGAIQAPVRTRVSAQPVSVSGAVAASTGFSHPAPGAVKTQGIHGYNAVDLAAGAGASIRAAAAGEVIVSKYSGWNGGYGRYIVIRHASGAQTLYAHLSSNSVGVGNYVSQGEVIGGMGNTGRSTGNHLHFEVRGGRNPF
jgi:murein DD-endopeptidase MepM/ murein hydrolase activator NlpD